MRPGEWEDVVLTDYERETIAAMEMALLRGDPLFGMNPTVAEVSGGRWVTWTARIVALAAVLLAAGIVLAFIVATQA